MKVLVTGAGGMLAQSLIPILRKAKWSVVVLPKAKLDVTDSGAVLRAIRKHKPTWVVNLAAYTYVDDAEATPDRARLVNEYGARNVAIATHRLGCRLLHVSTDYVFPGQLRTPIREYDPTGPRSVYGISKLAGECAIRDLQPDHLIVRTAWLYGPGGRNFVDSIVKLIISGAKPKVIDDQTGAPTLASDLSDALLTLMRINARGTYHVTNSGTCTWFEFANVIRDRYFEVFRAAYQQHHQVFEIEKTTSKDFGRPAQRPSYSVLDNSAYVQLVGQQLRPWQAALVAYLQFKESSGGFGGER